MARDSLQAVQAVRRRAVEQARYTLSVCLKAEADAADTVKAIDEDGAKDRAAHPVGENAYQFQEMFVRREYARQLQRGAAEAALVAAQAHSAEARAAVTATRTAEEAVRTLITERGVAAEAEANRRAQHVLDDIVRSRRRSKFP